MSKNLERYYQAWELRQQGKTSREIGIVMGIGGGRAAELVRYVTLIIRYRKPLSNKLKELVKEYEKT